MARRTRDPFSHTDITEPIRTLETPTASETAEATETPEAAETFKAAETPETLEAAATEKLSLYNIVGISAVRCCHVASREVLHA